MDTGLIGGSGVYQLEGLRICEEISTETPFGMPSAPIMRGEIAGKSVFFLPRHGINHEIPPHKINYRANIAALKQLGVGRIFSVGAVGCLHADWAVGSIVVPDQIIDMTNGSRLSTFFDKERVMHVDFSEPYCPDLRQVVISTATRLHETLIEKGVYICTQGPRLESAAEIRFYAMIGADIVGMTAMPEAVLAREAEICYCGISIITNAAAGIKKEPLTSKEVIETMQKSAERLRSLLQAMFTSLPQAQKCTCKSALKEAEI